MKKSKSIIEWSKKLKKVCFFQKKKGKNYCITCEKYYIMFFVVISADMGMVQNTYTIIGIFTCICFCAENYARGETGIKMNIAIPFLVSLLTGVMGYYFLGLFYRKKEPERSNSAFVFSKKNFIISSIYFVLSISLIFILLMKTGEKGSTFISFVLLFSFLFFSAAIDYFENIIPNSLVLYGLGVFVVTTLINVFVNNISFKESLLASAFGGIGIGGILLIIALIAKSALGMGDVKLFFVIGLVLGLQDTYYVLLVSIIIMAVVSIVLLILKKVSRKTKIPMAPFVALGFLVCVILGM